MAFTVLKVVNGKRLDRGVAKVGGEALVTAST